MHTYKDTIYHYPKTPYEWVHSLSAYMYYAHNGFKFGLPLHSLKGLSLSQPENWQSAWLFIPNDLVSRWFSITLDLLCTYKMLLMYNETPRVSLRKYAVSAYQHYQGIDTIYSNLSEVALDAFFEAYDTTLGLQILTIGDE